MTNQNLTKLQIIDRLLNNYQTKLAFYSRFKISNYKSQKKNFFEGNIKNPHFKYFRTKINLEVFQQELKKIKIKQTPFPGQILIKKKRELLLKTKIVARRGQAGQINLLSRKLFGEPTESLLKKAQKTLRGKKEEKSGKIISAVQAGSLIARQVQKYELPYHVVFKKINARVSVLKNTVRVHPQAVFFKKELKSLIIHELTHAFRRENSLAQNWKIFKLGFPGYLETEEGLAAFNEVVLGKNKDKLQLFAARVLACHLARKHSFRFVFEFLKKQRFNSEEAWQITVRAKRGLKDTAQPGVFFKDYLYFSGYLKIKKYFSAGKNPLPLYYGKIGLEDLPQLNQFKKLKYPKHLFSYDNSRP